MISKRQWPLQRVVDRRQNFTVTHDYPEGVVEELLACGHVYINPIHVRSPEHRPQAARRRCVECAKAQKGQME